MKINFLFIGTFSISLLLACGQTHDKSNVAISTDTSTINMNNIERLLESTFPFVEELLRKHGEFFPLASAVLTNDSIASVGFYDGDEQPLSNTVISNLKTAFIAKSEEYKAVAIFFDVRVVDPKTNLKTDAVAVFVESKGDSTAYTLYYPYVLTANNELLFSEAWRSENPKEIFID